MDEDLLLRLPLPLGQLYVRAHNAKAPLEMHQAAFYLWEAWLKLLGASTVMAYAVLRDKDPELSERLQNLARPALGHWWEFVRRLVAHVAEAETKPPCFAVVRDLILGPARADLPRAAGLDAALRDVLEIGKGPRSTVRMVELLDHIVQYRNREFGHGAAGQRPSTFYERMGRALLAGASEVLAHANVLGGGNLIYIDDVHLLPSRGWLIERYGLSGESARRIESIEVDEVSKEALPRPQQVYVEALRDDQMPSSVPSLRSLHPMVFYDKESGEFFFLNGQRGRSSAEYLSYSTGRVVRKDGIAHEIQSFAELILGRRVTRESLETWIERPQAVETPPERDDGGRPVRTLGGFELLSRIGQGGMAVVYRALQPSLGRQVALKCLVAPGDPRIETRFAREIRALGRVEHPNLIKVFTSGSEGDQWFYAMEVIEGVDLASVCDHLKEEGACGLGGAAWRGAMEAACLKARNREEALTHDPRPRPAVATKPSEESAAGTEERTGGTKRHRDEALVRRGAKAVPGRDLIAQAVDIIRQAAQAAHALHEAGVIHRDIKPGNIMVTADGKHAVLMDLGLAKLADDAEGRLTRTRQFVGTLRYASPEQLLAVGNLDRRSDVYSLGAALWETLTLQPLFGADDTTPTPALMLKIQSVDPERPRRLNPLVPSDLEAVVVKCLEKDRDRRYSTALDLAQDLARWQRGETVLAQPPTLRYLMGKYIRRHRAGLALAAILVLAGLGGTLAAFYRIQHARSVAEEALIHEERATTEAEKARHIAELALCDMHTSFGLQAGEQGRPAEAALWFAYAASRTKEHAERQVSNRIRARNWRRHSVVPVRALQHDVHFKHMSFHPSGRYLLLLGYESRCLLWDLKRDEPVALPGGHASISSAAWNPQGDRLALALPEGKVEVCSFPELETLDQVQHSGPVHVIAFSKDGRRLALGGDGARLWDCESKGYVTPLLEHPQAIVSLDLDSGGDLVATAALDDSCRVFSLERAEAPFLLFPPVPNVRVAGMLPARPFPPVLLGHRAGLLTLAQTNELAWWELPKCEKKLSIPFRRNIQRVVVSPDGRRFLVCAYFEAELWDVDKAQRVGQRLTHSNAIWNGAWSLDSETILTVGADRTARRWSLQGEPIGSPLFHLDDVLGGAFSPDGRHFATQQTDGLVRVWLPQEDEADGYRIGTSAEPFAVLSGDGRYFATTAPEGARLGAAVYETASGKRVGPILKTGGVPLGLVFSADGKELLTLSSDALEFEDVRRRVAEGAKGSGWIRFWRWEDGSSTAPALRTSSDPVAGVLSPRGDVSAAACAGGEILLLDSERRQARYEVKLPHPLAPLLAQNIAPDTFFEFLRFPQDGERLAVWGFGDSVTVLRTEDGEKVFTVGEHKPFVSDACFSPDGKVLLVASLFRKVILLDASNGLQIGRPLEHPDWIFRASFSPDGNHVFTACRDHMARIWEWRTGRLACPPLEHGDEAFDGVFLPGGHALITCSRDGTSRLWERSTGKPLSPSLSLEGWCYRLRSARDGNFAIVTGPMDALHVYKTDAFTLPELEGLDPEAVRLLAEIVAGQNIHEGGGVSNLTSSEWLERWRAFQRTSPGTLRYDSSAAENRWALLREVRRLRERGESAAAAARVRETLSTVQERSVDLWLLWLAIFLEHESPEEVLVHLPRPRAPGWSEYVEDVRWLLERLSRGEPIRIDCGSFEAHGGADGRQWGGDRFFQGGGLGKGCADGGAPSRQSYSGGIDAQGQDPEVYRTDRYFPPGKSFLGYKVPLPRGSYRIALHFAEICFTARGTRVFDVEIEGDIILRDYEPGAAGFAIARVERAEVEVTDGVLDLRLVPRLDAATLSAIEIEPAG